MIKLLYKYYPKILKKILFPSTIVLSFLSTLTYLYLTDQPLSISSDALYKLGLAFLIYFLIVSFLGIIISYNRIIFDLYNSSNPSKINNGGDKNIAKEIPKEELNYLPYQFEFDVINRKIIEYTVFIRRGWYPDEPKPGIESFLEALGFSEPRCGKCHNDFFKNYGGVESYECTNSNCDNDKRLYSNDKFEITQKIELQYKGTVRTNYDKYWGKYKKIYDEFTNKKYREYIKPSR